MPDYRLFPHIYHRFWFKLSFLLQSSSYPTAENNRFHNPYYKSFNYECKKLYTHSIDKKTLAKYLDFANHHQEATPDDIKKLCQVVNQYHFHSAFVNPYYVSLAKQIVNQDQVVGTVISFPLGQETTEIKLQQIQDAIKNGADELDISMNVGLFKSGNETAILDEMKSIITTAKQLKTIVAVKFIIETGLLTDDQIKKAAELVLQSGADFVKTCSGMGPRGATLKDVQLIKQAVGEKIKIKVAGGVDTYQEAIDFINAGVSRIGTSHAVQIIDNIPL